MNVQPPSIESVSVWYDPETDGFGLRMAGNDVDSDVIGLEMQIFDANGDPILAPDAANRPRLQFGELLQLAGRFTGTLSLPYSALLDFYEVQPPYSPPAQVEISALDAALLTSERQVLVPARPPALAEGAICDSIGGPNRCDEMHTASTRIRSMEPTSMRRFGQCADDWPVVDS